MAAAFPLLFVLPMVLVIYSPLVIGSLVISGPRLLLELYSTINDNN